MTTYSEDDITPEEQDRLEAMGTPVTVRPAPPVIDAETWAHLAAMERSHRFQATRSSRDYPATRTCSACGDTLDTGVRYCPGTGNFDHQLGDE